MALVGGISDGDSAMVVSDLSAWRSSGMKARNKLIKETRKLHVCSKMAATQRLFKSY